MPGRIAARWNFCCGDSTGCHLGGLRQLGGALTIVGDEQRTARGDDGEHRAGGQPATEAITLDQRLTDDRPDAEAAEHGNGEVAGRLGPPMGRGEIADHRRCADEQSAFADAGECTQRQEHPPVVDRDARDRCGGGEQRAGDDQDPTTVAVAIGPEQGTNGDRSDAERSQVEPDVDLAPTQPVLDQPRDERHLDADVHEEQERDERDRDERTADQPFLGRSAVDVGAVSDMAPSLAADPPGASRRPRRRAPGSSTGRSRPRAPVRCPSSRVPSRR